MGAAVHSGEATPVRLSPIGVCTAQPAAPLRPLQRGYIIGNRHDERPVLDDCEQGVGLHNDCLVRRQIHTQWEQVMPPPGGPPVGVLSGFSIGDLLKAYELLGELCAEHNIPLPEKVVQCGCGFCCPCLPPQEVQMCSESANAVGGSGGGGGVVGRRGKQPTTVMSDGGGGSTGGLANLGSSEVL